MKNLTHFYQPRNIDEACTILSKKNSKNVILAGGTAITSMKDQTISGLVDLKLLKLSYIKSASEGYSIGAMTTVHDLFQSDILTDPAGKLIKTTAGRIGSTLLRNSITVGGNLFCPFPWSDLPPAFLVLDATVVSRLGKHTRAIKLSDLYAPHPRNVLKPGEIITEIKISKSAPSTGTAFIKFAKTSNDYAMVDIAAKICLTNKKVSEAAIAVNAVTKHPTRCPEAETFLIGNQPTKSLFIEASKLVLKDSEITLDFRASKEYRREILSVLVLRCLEECAEQIQSKGASK